MHLMGDLATLYRYIQPTLIGIVYAYFCDVPRFSACHRERAYLARCEGLIFFNRVLTLLSLVIWCTAVFQRWWNIDEASERLYFLVVNSFRGIRVRSLLYKFHLDLKVHRMGLEKDEPNILEGMIRFCYFTVDGLLSIYVGLTYMAESTAGIGACSNLLALLNTVVLPVNI